MTTATLVLHAAFYHLSNGRRRDVLIGVVNRRRNGKKTRISVVDVGIATLITAAKIARQTSDDGTFKIVMVDHGDLGTFGMDDDARIETLKAIRALIELPPVEVAEPNVTAQAGRYGLRVIDCAC